MKKTETAQPSDEVREALDALFRDISLESELAAYVRDRNKYGGSYVPIIQVSDPNGLLDNSEEDG